jgi:hypothetical protein
MTQAKFVPGENRLICPSAAYGTGNCLQAKHIPDAAMRDPSRHA